MTKNSRDRLDLLLDGLEEMVLAADGRALLAEAKGDAAEAEAFITQSVARYRERRECLALADLPKRTRRSGGRSANRRWRLLGRLVASRPSLSKRVSAAFENGDADDREVEELLEELLRADEESGPDL